MSLKKGSIDNLEIKNLNVYYQNKEVLKNINFKINRGEIISIIGPNGSGKTSLLKSLIGGIKFDGNINVDGEKLDLKKHNISYMPQSGDLDINFPITVEEVVKMAEIKNLKLDKSTLKDILELSGIFEIKDRNLNEISGGQLQRVFFARTIVQDADIILLDEPVNHIDVIAETIILSQIKTMASMGKMVILTTHDLHLAKLISSKVLLINGEVIDFGEPQKVFNKENLEKTFGERIIFFDQMNNLTFVEDHVH